MEKLNKQQLQETVYEIIANQLQKDPSELNPNAHIQYDCGADSLDVVEISMNLEKELDIELDKVTNQMEDSTVEGIYKIVKDVYYDGKQ